MSQIEKRLRDLAAGNELPWYKVAALLVHFGATVQAPNGGSHYKVFIKGKPTLVIPVHNGMIKKVYAKKISDYLEEYIND